MDSTVTAAYRLTRPGITPEGGPSDVADTLGSVPVQDPVQTVAAVDLPAPLMERLPASVGTGDGD